MTEFKVGDKVKAAPSGYIYRDVKDLPGVVVAVQGYGSWPIEVDFNGYKSSSYPCKASELIKEGAPVVEKRQVVVKGGSGAVLTVDAEWPETKELWTRFPDGSHCTFEEDQVEDYTPAPVAGEYWQYQYANKPSRIYEVTEGGWVVFGLEHDEGTTADYCYNARQIDNFTERYKKVDG